MTGKNAGMKPLPMPLRLAAGLVATALEEAQELPRKLTELPMTAVSQALQASMRVQQRVTELAIKGDRALGALRPVPETPTWARFDEDEELGPPNGMANGLRSLEPPSPPRVTPVRILPDPDDEPVPTPRRLAEHPTDRTLLEPEREPEVAAKGTAQAAPAGSRADGAAARDDSDGPEGLPEYEQWTLPQLRGRFRSLSLDQLQALLVWETTHLDRPPYVTMLSNRIASVTGR
ncbi:MAG TPA: lipid droplet-associated protein [Pseudonocardia sp.]|jgi:hypothetical protein